MNQRKVSAWFGAAAVAMLVATPTLPGQTPQTPYENLKSSVQGTRVTITYDLVSADPNDFFKVALEVKTKGTGQVVPVSAASVTGDGAGPALHPGKDKRIVWNAGLDVEVPQFDLYDFSIVIDRVVTGEISVQSEPNGATVVLDNEPQPRGRTPLTIEGVTPGTHRIVLSRDGYLPNSQEAVVEIGKTTTVTRTLTPNAPTSPAQGPGRGGTIVPPKSGGIPKWIIPAAGGGAAAAYLGLKGKKVDVITPPPTTCTYDISPATNLSPIPQTGGTVQVSVSVSSTTCTPQAWTTTVATDSMAFLHMPSGGTGGQTILVTVDANPPSEGNPSRGGSATIAGKTFTITGQTNAIQTSGFTGASEGSGSATFSPVSGVTVVPGQKLTITPGGSLNVPGITSPVLPIGTAGNVGSQGRVPGFPANALVCAIGDQTIAAEWFVVPATITFTPGSLGGQLFCGMNATNTITGYTGVTGTWTLTVTVGG